MDAVLLERVAVADRHRVIFFGLEIDGDAERRADFVVATVAFADRTTRVVLNVANIRGAKIVRNLVGNFS